MTDQIPEELLQRILDTPLQRLAQAAVRASTWTKSKYMHLVETAYDTAEELWAADKESVASCRKSNDS